MPSVASEFSSDPASLTLARGFVRRCLAKLGLGGADACDVLIAVGEACSNAIVHAASHKGYTISCAHYDRRLTFKVLDFGRGFMTNTYVRDHQPGGLGIRLMRSLMDEVRYQTDASGTTVTLVKKV
jgi:anti-sigma regulatory factor (Ser/Thr protein kinase)